MFSDDPAAGVASRQRLDAAAVVAELIDHRDPGVRSAVAASAAVDAATLEQFAGDPHSDVRRTAAAHRRCPSEVLAELVQDPDPQVRAAAVANPNYGMLANRRALETARPDAHDTGMVGAAVQAVPLETLEDPGCGPGVLRQGAADSDVFKRAAVAGHRNCPDDVVRMLACDRNPWVLQTLAAAQPCPPEVFAQLTAHPLREVRSAAASNPECPFGSFIDLASDTDAAVRSAAASNPECPLGLLIELSSGYRRSGALRRSQQPRMPDRRCRRPVDQRRQQRCAGSRRSQPRMPGRHPGASVG